jgi:hypothetical protein
VSRDACERDARVAGARSRPSSRCDAAAARQAGRYRTRRAARWLREQGPRRHLRRTARSPRAHARSLRHTRHGKRPRPWCARRAAPRALSPSGS